MFSHKCGQLGNRLFAFSHFIATAAAHNHKIVNLSFDEYARYFSSTSQDIFCRYPASRSMIKSNKMRHILFMINRLVLKVFRTISFNGSFLHQVVVADLPRYQFNTGNYLDMATSSFQEEVKKPLIFLFGRFFRDYSNFSKYKGVIRSYFMPTDEIQHNIERFIRNARSGADLLVGVHIRRGDYRQFANGNYFFSPPNYAEKMKELAANEPSKKIRFVICSNEAIDTSVFAQHDFLIGPGHLVEDMYILAGCNFIFGTPSTYTRWASFYGNVPLYQIEDLGKAIRLSDFVILEDIRLFDF